MVLTSSSVAMVESFSLSVSTDELTSVPGTSLQSNKLLSSKQIKYQRGQKKKQKGEQSTTEGELNWLPVGTSVRVTLAQHDAVIAGFLAGASLGFTTFLTSTAWKHKDVIG